MLTRNQFGYEIKEVCSKISIDFVISNFWIEYYLQETKSEVTDTKINKNFEKDSNKELDSEKDEEKKYNYNEETKTNIVNLDSINTNSKKSSHNQDEKNNKGNFLYNIRYGNLPVMEFKLPDGTSGSVDKVPRRWHYQK